MERSESSSHLLQNTFEIEEPEMERKIRWRFWRLHGWTVSVSYGVFVSLFTLLINFTVLIWAACLTTHPLQGTNKVLFYGSCGKSKKIFTLTHLLINILSTMLLASSNVAMQILLAPTRSDINKAHDRASWLHIGVAGVRNVKLVPRRQARLFVILALSSIPLHLFCV